MTIPGTFSLLGVAVYGNEMLVDRHRRAASRYVYNTSATGVFDNLTLTLLDITNPNNPTILGQTFVTPEQFPVNEQGQKTDVVSLGNGDFAVSDTDANGNPALLVVDPSNPNNMIVGATQVPSGVHGITVSGDMLYASTSSGLSIYQIEPLVSDPVTSRSTCPPARPRTSSRARSTSRRRRSSRPPPATAGLGSLVRLGQHHLHFTWQTTLSDVQAGADDAVTTGASAVVHRPGDARHARPAGDVGHRRLDHQRHPASQTVQPGGRQPTTSA